MARLVFTADRGVQTEFGGGVRSVLEFFQATRQLVQHAALNLALDPADLAELIGSLAFAATRVPSEVCGHR